MEKRLGKEAFGQRRFLEEKIVQARKMPRQKNWKEKFLSKAFFLQCILKSFGLYDRGFLNYLDPLIVEHEVYLPALPLAFDGFRLLQLSDLHFALAGEFLEKLLLKLNGIICDGVVFTGDYCSKVGRDHEHVLQAMKNVLDVLPMPRWGVLGNYDLLELVPHLEKQKLRILLNESNEIKRGGESLFICGVDDPIFFRTHNLTHARKGIPLSACTILLVHSPTLWREAEALGYSLMLCGHTHGGQICLPGGWPLFRNVHVPDTLMCGSWKEGTLIGYTSPGTGASQLPVRFNCPGEITIHILRHLEK